VWLVPYINHVAVPVDDVARVSDFYVDWLGARVIPSPGFPVPVSWLMLGKIQVHLVQHTGERSGAYHFAVTVETAAAFDDLYRRAEREGHLATEAFPQPLFEMPDGAAQMWIRDTCGNVIECDYPRMDELASDVRGAASRWADLTEQSAWNLSATIFRPEQAGIAPTHRMEVR
jgi:catechol 2,3-dioxygenase-like lactoylglutathione lyase family enzyme